MSNQTKAQHTKESLKKLSRKELLAIGAEWFSPETLKTATRGNAAMLIALILSRQP